VRRVGDNQNIDGNYQYNAVTKGNCIQKFWHYSKQLAIKNILPPAKKDLVLGCGSGVIASYLGKFGANILGIDGNTKAIEFAKKNIKQIMFISV